MSTTNKTKVIFRVFNGEVIAIFPEEYFSLDYFECASYLHVGQHGACNPDYVIQHSLLATQEEYQFLYDELTKVIGYDLQVCKRYTTAMLYKRYDTFRQSMKG